MGLRAIKMKKQSERHGWVSNGHGRGQEIGEFCGDCGFWIWVNKRGGILGLCESCLAVRVRKFWAIWDSEEALR